MPERSELSPDRGSSASRQELEVLPQVLRDEVELPFGDEREVSEPVLVPAAGTTKHTRTSRQIPAPVGAAAGADAQLERSGLIDADVSEVNKDWTSLQVLVHECIGLVGGYWSPGAAVLRLTEEIGELADAVAGHGGEVGEECADVLIISSCIANQFQVGLASLTTFVAPRQAGDVPTVADLASSAGRVARIVNFYDGPKVPRVPDHLEHLEQPILELQRDVRALAASLDVDIDAQVFVKANVTVRRDAHRFVQSFDPNVAKSLKEFQATRRATACSFGRVAKLWGAPTWQVNRNTSYNCEAAVPFLLRFAKAANNEGLDGFVMKVSSSTPPKTVVDVAGVLRDVVFWLTRFDPAGPGVAQEVRPEPGWQFSFGGQRMFITVFADVYPTDHVRYSAGGTFLMFQPEESFSLHGVGDGQPGSGRIKEMVRSSFAKAGQSYPLTLINARIEAGLYLLPAEGEEMVQWWESSFDLGQLQLF